MQSCLVDGGLMRVGQYTEVTQEDLKQDTHNKRIKEVVQYHQVIIV